MAELDVLTTNDDKDNGGPLMADLLGNYLEETDQVNKFQHANDDDDEKNLTKELNIDDQAWKNYVDQHPQLPEFDIISYKCMCTCSEILPVDLLFNETAHNRVKDLVKLAIKWYNDRRDTQFLPMHIVKANFNYHYTVDRYYITFIFIAKDDKSYVFNEFVGTVAHKLSTDECFSVFCGERFRPKLPENPCSQHLLIDITTGDEPLDHENVDKSDQIRVLREEDIQLSQKYLEKLEESGLSLLDQPFYPEFVKDKVFPGEERDDFTPEKRCIL